MTHLTSLDTSQVHTDKHQALHPLTEKVLTLYSQLPKEIDTLPTRILHGDPKLENILFKEDAEEAIALIDLDTVGTYPLLIEIGDLGRSWTRVTNRDGKAAFSPERWHTAFDGYRETATSVTPAEWRLFPYGCLLVTLELSARFIIDAYEEFYFAHDIEKFPTRYEQNLFAAKDQLAFLDDFIKKMPEIQAMHSV